MSKVRCEICGRQVSQKGVRECTSCGAQVCKDCFKKGNCRDCYELGKDLNNLAKKSVKAG